MGSDRESKLESIAELIERDLTLIGATAVEDKLQQGVTFLSRLFWVVILDV